LGKIAPAKAIFCNFVRLQSPKMMRLQVIQDGSGKNTGVFIPIEDWVLITAQYPNIENTQADPEAWEKKIIDDRLEAIAQNPTRLKPGQNLLNLLRPEF
jgi:hypothetical protein